MKVREALDKELLRVVPFKKESNWPQPYKDKPIEDYRKYKNQEVALLNYKKAFLFIKDKEVSKVTFTTDSGNAVVFIDVDKNELPESLRGNNRGTFSKFTVTKKNLDADIISLSSVKNLVGVSYVDVAMQVIKGEVPEKKILASFICDERTHEIFDDYDLVKLTQNPELIEIAKLATPRARLLVAEIKARETKPKALSLFKTKELSDAVKLV